MAPRLRVYVPPHPLIQHWLGVARDVHTPTTLFRTALGELGRWLTYEAVREWLPTEAAEVETPLGPCPATFIDPGPPIAVVPILRAGLALLEGMLPVLPLASVYHLGLVRDEATLEATCYLNKLPPTFAPDTRVIVSEPMLATGGSIMTALGEIVQRGVSPDQVRIVSIVAAPPALQKLNEAFPDVVIYTATVDEDVNSQGYIVPGLGDAGDRAFGT